MPEPLHVISPSDLPDEDRAIVLRRARELKATDPNPVANRLRVGALYFNPSLRTRASFEQAVRVVGGSCQTMNVNNDTWSLEFDPNAVMDGDKVENIAEAARVLGRFYHILGVRSFRGASTWEIERSEPILRKIAKYAGVPLISLEGATHHPCQSLADLMTMQENFGQDLTELPVALCWSWHPRALPAAVPHSFVLQSALAGCDVNIVHPEGLELDSGILDQARAAAAARGGKVTIHYDREEGLRGRRVVYAKSWGPLFSGKPADASLRGWCLTEDALKVTDGARVMHCLPVRRNVVIAGDVLDGPRSLVVDEAENRLWVQAALVEHLARKQGVIP
jgi:N-acetylornithine carbamoyltransferase